MCFVFPSWNNRALFSLCPRVRAVWNYFTPYQSRLSSSPFSVNSSCIFFPFSSRASSPSFSLYCYLIATILLWIWQTRNLATFRNSVLNVNQIVNLIKKDISCRILCAKQDEKENFWSTSNVLCKISDANSISLNKFHRISEDSDNRLLMKGKKSR